jgi:phenylacetate-coenzyme A ligase PaaK-like adenylate-forming protein
MPLNWKFSPEYYSRSQKLLDIALQEIPIYRSWRDLDPGPGVPIDARFAAMPALTKKDIREHFPQGILPAYQNLANGLASHEINLVETSGTTDDKITNIWNQQWWDASERSSWKLNSFLNQAATGEHREAILANPRNVGFISDEVDLPFEKRRLSHFLYLNEKTDPTAWSAAHMDRIIAELEVFRPSVLEANPSLLARLCRYAFKNHKKVYSPDVITFTYEYPTRYHLQQVQRVFRSPLVSSYGSTETGYVFLQCEKGKLHQNSDFCRVDFEPLKAEHGGPLLGRILVTPFGNPWAYLLRFNVADMAYLEDSGKCACGRNSGQILSRMAGRVVNLTLTCSGRLVSLYELDSALSILDGVDLYKLNQTGPLSYELHLVAPEANSTLLGTQAAQILQKLYGQEAKIAVIFDADIKPEGSGKYLVSRTLFPIDLDKYLDK